MEHTMEHTKGPWKVGGHTSIIIYTEQGWPVADANPRWGEEEARANARLIASAPALLEALKGVLHTIQTSDQWWMDCTDKGGFDVGAIRAAIAQAEAE